jgi:YfiH family protein
MIERRIGRALVRCTDRHGGVSAAPYASANLGDHVGDAPAAVAENRRRVAGAVAVASPAVPPDPDHFVWLQQVHGNAVAVVADAPRVAPRADAAVTDRAGLPLVVLVADCAPIAVVGERAVGVVHAGWSGLEQGVVERAVEVVRAVDGSPGARIRAVLGPCVHPCHYEFGADGLERLVGRFGDEVATSTEWGTPAFDVPAAVRVALARAGVDDLDDVGVCTASSPDHFSHRRDGPTGRQALVAALVA